jgi:pimeloyl-ACP methyl ester carboxylesterase
MDARVDEHRQIALLAEFHGERPAAPDWFRKAIAYAPERSLIDADGTAIETLAWGERGAPGLLFMHGNSAHADWWSFIGPLFAEHWRVAALSFAGMGGSGRRASYSIDEFKREAFAAAEAAGLFESERKPIFIGHSLGAIVTAAAGADSGERLGGAVFVDPPFRTPERMKEWRARRAGVSPRSLPDKVYPTLAAALARFRFLPPQTTEHLYLVDHIARASLTEGEGGWSWRFDPELWLKMRWRDTSVDLQKVQCPSAFIHGERSRLMHAEDLEFMWSATPIKAPVVMIPEAHHHLMMDQPLAFVAGLRGLLAGWPG